MVRVHRATREDAGGVTLASANVPWLPYGIEGRVHPPRGLAASTLTTCIVGATTVRVVRSIAIRQRA